MCSLEEVRRGCRRLGAPPTAAGGKCCLCWCCCCSCSWAKCLAAKGGSENGPTKKPREPSPCDPLLCEGEPPPTLEEIQSWGQSFDRLMKCAAGRKVFRDFLRCEYSEENILFWCACEDLKREVDPDAVEEKARFIYDDYISILSPKEVSLDSRVREIVNRNMVEPTPHTFDEAQLQIYTLMHRDSYPRFVNSPLYKALANITCSSPPSTIEQENIHDKIVQYNDGTPVKENQNNGENEIISYTAPNITITSPKIADTAPQISDITPKIEDAITKTTSANIGDLPPKISLTSPKKAEIKDSSQTSESIPLLDHIDSVTSETSHRVIEESRIDYMKQQVEVKDSDCEKSKTINVTITDAKSY